MSGIKMKFSGQYMLLFAWIVAIVAMGGSLFFSEIMHFTPCTLCWYQRILMYPLVIILGIAYLVNDTSVRKYVLPISVLGLILAVCHFAIQMLQPVHLASFCVPGNPCTEKFFALFGFVTIPFLSGTAFLLITLSMMLIQRERAAGSDSDFKTGRSVKG